MFTKPLKLEISLKPSKSEIQELRQWIPLFIALFTLVILSASGIFVEYANSLFAWAFGPENPECFELGTCDLFAEPFNTMIIPFQATLGDFTLVIAWAIIIGILWIRVSNTMMVAIVGVALAALFTQGFSEEAQTIGYALLAAAVAVAIYQILTVRVHFPTN